MAQAPRRLRTAQHPPRRQQVPQQRRIVGGQFALAIAPGAFEHRVARQFRDQFVAGAGRDAATEFSTPGTCASNSARKVSVIRPIVSTPGDRDRREAHDLRGIDVGRNAGRRRAEQCGTQKPQRRHQDALTPRLGAAARDQDRGDDQQRAERAEPDRNIRRQRLEIRDDERDHDQRAGRKAADAAVLGRQQRGCGRASPSSHAQVAKPASWNSASSDGVRRRRSSPARRRRQGRAARRRPRPRSWPRAAHDGAKCLR